MSTPTPGRMRPVFLAGLLALLLILTGAGSAQPLQVWTSLEAQSLTWLEDQVAAFEDAFATPVEIVTMPLGELRERALTGAPEGAAADLFVGVPHTEVYELAGAGVLSPLEPYATRGYLADLSEPARLAFTFGGDLIGLPLWIEGPALIINTDLVKRRPDSYEEFISLARELTAGSDLGFTFDATNPYYAYAWLRGHGGYVFARDEAGDFDTDSIGLAGEGAVAGARALQDLRFEHGLIPAGNSYERATRLFADGRLAMTFDGPWAAALFRNEGIPVAVGPLPHLESGPWGGFIGASGVLMNGFSEAKVTSVNLAKWLVRTEAQLELAGRAFRVPASLSAAAANGDENLAGFAQALRHGEPLPGVPEMGAVWQPLGDALSRLLAMEDADPAAELRTAVDRIAR